MKPLMTSFGPVPSSFVIVTSVGSTWRTIENFASALPPGAFSFTRGCGGFGQPVGSTVESQLIGSMLSITRSRLEWLRIVTNCQLSRIEKVPQ